MAVLEIYLCVSEYLQNDVEFIYYPHYSNKKISLNRHLR